MKFRKKEALAKVMSAEAMIAREKRRRDRGPKTIWEALMAANRERDVDKVKTGKNGDPAPGPPGWC